MFYVAPSEEQRTPRQGKAGRPIMDQSFTWIPPVMRRPIVPPFV